MHNLFSFCAWLFYFVSVSLALSFSISPSISLAYPLFSLESSFCFCFAAALATFANCRWLQVFNALSCQLYLCVGVPSVLSSTGVTLCLRRCPCAPCAMCCQLNRCHLPLLLFIFDGGGRRGTRKTLPHATPHATKRHRQLSQR